MIKMMRRAWGCWYCNVAVGRPWFFLICDKNDAVEDADNTGCNVAALINIYNLQTIMMNMMTKRRMLAIYGTMLDVAVLMHKEIKSKNYHQNHEEEEDADNRVQCCCLDKDL